MLVSNYSNGSALDGEVEDYQITIKNTIEGTGSPDDLSASGTSADDLIIGGKGEDTLTGGAGQDYFYFNETSEGVDWINDFTRGEDKIDISKILSTELGYSGSDPIGDSRLVLVEFSHPSLGNSTIVQIDFDGAGGLNPKDLVFVEGVTGMDINDFII